MVVFTISYIWIEACIINTIITFFYSAVSMNGILYDYTLCILRFACIFSFHLLFFQNHRDDIQRKFDALRDSCSVSDSTAFCLCFQQQEIKFFKGFTRPLNI